VQQPFDIEGGSLLKLTIAHWFTPKGKSIEEEGISPDIEVLFQDEDFENEYDRQLEEAKKILQSFEEVGSIQLAIDRYLALQEEETQE
jgi:carboxyl-terminal processing protease